MKEEPKIKLTWMVFLMIIEIGIVFTGLKLFGCINWEWKWVTAPIWVPIGYLIFVILMTPAGERL